MARKPNRILLYQQAVAAWWPQYVQVQADRHQANQEAVQYAADILGIEVEDLESDPLDEESDDSINEAAHNERVVDDFDTDWQDADNIFESDFAGFELEWDADDMLILYSSGNENIPSAGQNIPNPDLYFPDLEDYELAMMGEL